MAWWHIGPISELRRLRREDLELGASLGYIVNLRPIEVVSKIKKKKKRQRKYRRKGGKKRKKEFKGKEKSQDNPKESMKSHSIGKEIKI